MKQILLTTVLLLASCSPARAIADPTPHPTPSATLRTTSEPFGNVELPHCTVTAEALHVRSGPGIEHPVTGYLYAGDVVTVINQRGAWLDIGDGWIHSHYCEE